MEKSKYYGVMGKKLYSKNTNKLFLLRTDPQPLKPYPRLLPPSQIKCFKSRGDHLMADFPQSPSAPLCP